MGHGSDGASGIYRTGFRANSNRSGTTPAHDWANYPDCLAMAIDRLRGVVIESRDALDVCCKHDSPDTLHYVDPPYMHGTRTRANRRPDSGGVYRHELTDEEHQQLLEGLKQLVGMVVLSGYPSEAYDWALTGWRRVDRAAHTDGALERTEVLWLNPAAAKACPHGDLFEVAA
jgi:DNA adenine methylase